MLITRQLAVTTILVLSASFAGAEEAGSNLSRDEVDTLLKAHNGARKLVGAPAVKWSPELAGYAQQWADQIAASGKLEHRTEHKYGENLAAGYGNGYGIQKAASRWLEEKKEFAAGNRDKALHYTQVIWSRTTHIGAGKAVIQTGPMKGWTVFTCNYDPPGNIRGQEP